jgi:hypothetical protein
MAKRELETTEAGTFYHLPRPAWHLVTRFQEQTHPDIPLDDFSIDLVVREVRRTGSRDDPRCPKGQRREISFVIELYFTITIKGKLVKNPEVECTYKEELTFQASGLKARIKEGSYREGDCK